MSEPRPRWALWDFEGEKWDEVPADNAPGEWLGGHLYGRAGDHDYLPYPHVAGPQRIYCRTCGDVINIETAAALDSDGVVR